MKQTRDKPHRRIMRRRPELEAAWKEIDRLEKSLRVIANTACGEAQCKAEAAGALGANTPALPRAGRESAAAACSGKEQHETGTATRPEN